MLDQTARASVKLRFITEAGIESSFIRWWTWGQWSHVDYVMPGGQSFLGARLNGGVQIRPFDYCTPKNQMTAEFWMPAANAQKWQDALVSQLGKPYDWLAIVGIGVRRDWRNSKKWFCSELIQWASEEAKHPLLDAGPDVYRITPRDLALAVHVADLVSTDVPNG